MTETTAPQSRPVTEVAVGVLVRADGAVLLADRPMGKPYAGYWEFPGGKIESGESVEQALARELAEELGLTVHCSIPWVVIEYNYPHAYVRLHFRRIHDWTGTPCAVEGQKLLFLLPGDTPPAPLLPAAVAAMRWIQLPTVTAYSPQTAATAQEAVQWLQSCLDRGLRQIIWIEPQLNPYELDRALTQCTALAAVHGARLLLAPGDLARAELLAGELAPPVIGCFLSPAQLRGARERPKGGWLAAGVQTPADSAQAAALGCDFMVLDTSEAANLGAATTADSLRASQLCAAAPLPLYVPADLHLENLRAAQRMGAHGLAVRLSTTNH